MQDNDPTAISVFTWFSEDLLFVDDYQSAPIVNDLIGLIQDEGVKQQVLNFLRSADFNIVDLEVNERPPHMDWYGRLLNQSGEQPHFVNQLLTVHKVYDKNGGVVGKRRLPLESESRGTRKIVLLALAFINAEMNGDGKTLLLDEFNDSLHPELAKAMIRIFNSVANQNQFILTTNELQLLDSKVRIDQIYLVEKDFKGVSNLTSIFDFKDTRNTTRGGISYMKRSVEGRFGAMPVIDPDQMLNALAARDNDIDKSESGAL